MLTISEGSNIYVYVDPVDMRKSINGLIIILREVFDVNPQSGDLYLFVNKSRNKIKCLVWDANGFVLYYKRLEKGRFNYSKYLSGNQVLVTQAQLKALLMGLDFYLVGKQPESIIQEFF